MASSGSSKLGTPMRSQAPQSPYPSQPQPPPPIIPTSYLAPHEQRGVIVAIFGLIEAIKVWDVVAPYFIPHPEPTWSSGFRVRGPWTTLGWTVFEVVALALVSLLRIPRFSPSNRQIALLSLGLGVYNLLCWFVTEPGSFFQSIHLIGPTALGGEWYWAWWYSFKRWREPAHLEGIHKIRLLPYSTATLNPLSLTYCIPPHDPQPVYIPIVFNNSIPEEVSYFIRSLETGNAEVKTVSGSSLKRSQKARSQPLLTDIEEDEEDGEPEIDPLSALVARSDPLQLDLAKLPSVRPSDSLTIVPPKLASSQSVRFITVDSPSVISLKSVLDHRGDRFHITPHKEAVIIECPAGGDFMLEDTKKGQLVLKGPKAVPAELRCVGDEEVAQFQARGVGSLKVGWRKKSKDSTVSGVVEGIEDEVVDTTDQPLALVRRDKVAKTHTVPLRLVHDQPGVHTVTLTSVTDSMHNSYTPSGHSAEKIYNVIPRPTAKLDCPRTKQILIGQTTSLPILIDGLGSEALEVVYTFQAANSENVIRNTVKVSRKTESITVSEAGKFTLLEINGPCSGYIMEPSSCIIDEIPQPSVDLQVTTLHECAMDVGVTASFDFTGSPPFMVEYTEKRNNARASTRSARFNGHSGQIVLQPDQEGQYTYTFVSLSDSKYSQVRIDKPPIQQTVHPLANIELAGQKQRKLFACSNDQIDVEFEAKGANPLKLNYLVSHAGKVDNITRQVSPGQQRISVDVPVPLTSAKGGSGRFTVSLVSVEDGNGCVRRLNSPSIDVDVDRRKPTARFAKSEKIVITEGQTAKAALRLTGTAPWEVSYTLDGKAEKKVTMRDPNNQLTLDQMGTYRLTRVKDAHCAGDVLDTDATFDIDFKPRPQVSIVPSEQLRDDRGVFRHKGMCAGEEDSVAVRFNGQAPFELVYRYTANGKTSRHTLKSAQEVGILHLSPESGKHRYDITELKDSNYPSNAVSLVVEHEVHGRPSASFVKLNTKPICLDSPISGDAKVKLNGKAPFDLSLAIRRPGTTRVESYSIQVKSNEWTLDLPYEAKDVGRHEVMIVLVKDQSGCEMEVNDGDILTTVVEVVESARIVPVSQVEDLCVGDNLDFLLQGKAPWTVEYEWLGRKHKVSSSASRFSRYAEEKGLFSVKSVALKDNQCKRDIKGMDRRVHPLPSVKIEEGQSALREGDDPAAFSVSFTGTPPYSFTYTRSEQVGSKTKVVDTRTVTDIYEAEYTISSSAPGDYAVVSVSDKYCRYPPTSRGREA